MNSKDKVLQPTYKFYSLDKIGPPAITIAVLAALALTGSPIQAQNAEDSLESPPPLTDEELSRSINTAPARSDDSTATEQKSGDASPGAADVITEYRIQQKLYLIEVNPRLGGSYYMSDSDGDGSLEEYRQNTESDANIGKWRLGSW